MCVNFFKIVFQRKYQRFSRHILKSINLHDFNILSANQYDDISERYLMNLSLTYYLAKEACVMKLNPLGRYHCDEILKNTQSKSVFRPSISHTAIMYHSTTVSNTVFDADAVIHKIIKFYRILGASEDFGLCQQPKIFFLTRLI